MRIFSTDRGRGEDQTGEYAPARTAILLFLVPSLRSLERFSFKHVLLIWIITLKSMLKSASAALANNVTNKLDSVSALHTLTVLLATNVWATHSDTIHWLVVKRSSFAFVGFKSFWDELKQWISVWLPSSGIRRCVSAMWSKQWTMLVSDSARSHANVGTEGASIRRECIL